MIYKQFPHSIDFIFALLTVSFAVWEILSLTQSRFLTFALVACALAIRLTKTSIGEFLSYIFFQEFCGIRPYAKGLDPFELSFMNGVRKGSSFFALHVFLRSPSTVCWRDYSLSQAFLVPLSNISGLNMLRLNSGWCVCFCVGTKLLLLLWFCSVVWNPEAWYLWLFLPSKKIFFKAESNTGNPCHVSLYDALDFLQV